MSNSINNEYSIFLRPANAPPNIYKKVSLWLQSKKYFYDWQDAYNYLIDLETKNPQRFRFLVSEYYATHKDYAGYLTREEYENNYNQDAVNMNAYRTYTSNYIYMDDYTKPNLHKNDNNYSANLRNGEHKNTYGEMAHMYYTLR